MKRSDLNMTTTSDNRTLEIRNGRSVMLILLCFGFSLSSCSGLPPRSYHYVDKELNWTDAQRYCREKYTDLAMFESQDDMSRLPPNVFNTFAWIGLRDDPKSWKESMGNDLNSWRSSATGETSKTGFHKWGADQPKGRNAKNDCVVMRKSGTWQDWQCQTNYMGFICYTVTDGNEKTFQYISTEKTWSAARDYCREHHTDLPMIENQEDYDKILLLIPADTQVWIGLYRVRWTWSDGSQSSFTSWQSGSPDKNGINEYCVAETVHHEWVNFNCGLKFPFICHQGPKFETRLRIKVETDADLTDPATNTELLQQMEAALRRQGLTGFKLRWTMQPKKQEEEKLEEPQCNVHV